jgi:lysyl-tRNA synthetase class II
VSISFDEFIKKYSYLTNENSANDTSVSIAGRVLSVRHLGEKLIFIDLYSQSQKIQVVVNKKQALKIKTEVCN